VTEHSYSLPSTIHSATHSRVSLLVMVLCQ